MEARKPQAFKPGSGRFRFPLAEQEGSSGHVAPCQFNPVWGVQAKALAWVKAGGQLARVPSA